MEMICAESIGELLSLALVGPHTYMLTNLFKQCTEVMNLGMGFVISNHLPTSNYCAKFYSEGNNLSFGTIIFCTQIPLCELQGQYVAVA